MENESERESERERERESERASERLTQDGVFFDIFHDNARHSSGGQWRVAVVFLLLPRIIRGININPLARA